MVEKFFLALDYETHKQAKDTAFSATKFLEKQYGEEFVRTRTGLKINQDLLTGVLSREEQDYLGNIRFLRNERGCQIFADMKISHGGDTGLRIIERVKNALPTDYITVATDLDLKILKEYAEIGNDEGVKLIGFTKHTKIPPEDVQRDHNKTLADVIYTRSQMASEAGFDAVVMEANVLKDERIAKLPIKKLVTGIRIDVSEKGAQQRVSSLEDVANVKPLTAYTVISSRYLGSGKEDKLKQIIDALM
jgi:orotidine-5'-phosphate decarboxylase